ncbi:hypothetical protein AB836_01065 [Rickettsiales bacterium (ex Bugula neritina AB1)]|nr:hypothetical protein AB836_01065 [Rickettsiales bacterium (ex Bugula neritina AB1)]
MVVYFDSGIAKYIIWLSILNFFLSFLSLFFGISMFFFYSISFILIILIFYLFRADERKIFQNNGIIAYGDGDILDNYVLSPEIFGNNDDYNCLEIKSNFSNIYFKYAPVNGKIIDIIEFYGYEKKSFNYNINISKSNKYVGFQIQNEKDFFFILFEVLHIDKNYSMYKIYVEKNTDISQGDLIFCSHFYSKSYFFIDKKYSLLVHKGEKVLYKQTIIALLE